MTDHDSPADTVPFALPEPTLPTGPQDERRSRQVIDVPDGAQIVGETIITGRDVGRYDLLAVCAHRNWYARPTVAVLEDDAGVIAGHRLQVKVKCADCGSQGRFTGETLVSADGETLGALIEVIPADPG